MIMLIASSIVVSRDQQIERLTWEVNQLRRELARVKVEDQMVIESLHNRVHELEMELADLRQIAESTTTVCSSLYSLSLVLSFSRGRGWGERVTAPVRSKKLYRCRESVVNCSSGQMSLLTWSWALQ